MSEEKEQEAAGKEQEQKRERKRLFSYRWIVKNIPFFLFLSALAVVYIYNGHYADKTIRDINKVSRELKELQYEFKTLKSEVMYRSKQSEMAKAVEPLGLKELITPPVILSDTAGNKKEE
ncbi:FtsL-like putative cell division protein [Paraflavitalea pollutisoli]|uniref:FtsL-like putative cell division protein n=1 Tax=Paraflavitalea pollutisoli TaxID=3034143 RepID=UPI0023EC3740|nr:FtsL-like putative cell division protein [Paraflavitalea sp. H1-2-19X]